MNAAQIIVDVVLDDETLSEIQMMRTIRLAHYEKMAKDPQGALELLKRAGLTEESTIDDVVENVNVKVRELRGRIAQPNIVYEDELSLYVNSL